MSNRRLCWMLVLVFVTPIALRGQAAQPQDDDSITKKTTDENDKIVALAMSVIDQYDPSTPRLHSLTKRRYISTLQTLSASLDSLKIHEQALVLKAINYLVRDSAAEVCNQVIQEHESDQVSNEDWIKTLRYTADLLPSYMNEPFLKSLEAWEEKYPFQIKKVTPETMFRPSFVAIKNAEFLQLATKSKSSFIADTAFNAQVQQDENSQSSLQNSANRNLASTNPKHRLYGIQLFSRLNPAWSGHQVRLKQLTKDPDKRVSHMATQVWLSDSSSGDTRNLFNALSSDADIQQIEALKRIDTSVIRDWGSIEPVAELVSSQAVDVRMEAIKTICRNHPHIVTPLTRAIENDPDRQVRQFALNQVQLLGWYPPGNNDDEWNRNDSAAPYFALLADAERGGLEIDNALIHLTKPYGYRPHLLYEKLKSGQMWEGQKLQAIAQLLDSDPSLNATETAIAAVREVILENQAKNKSGYLGLASTSRNMISRHALRLAPLVPELCSFIEQTRSQKLVPTLSSFGAQGKPSIGLLIKILEDDSGKWKQSRRAAINAIRTMQHHGKPALKSLLKVAQDNDYSVSLIAALTYLDLGGDPAELMPEYALTLPVLVKIDPAALIEIPEFRTKLQSAVVSDCPWNLILWLGPRAEFLMPELKLKYKQLMPTPNSQSSLTEKLIELLPLLPSAQEEFVPMCIEYLEKEPRSMRCRTALETLSKIGDDQRLAENAVRSLMGSGTEYIRRTAKSCYEKIYEEQGD